MSSQQKYEFIAHVWRTLLYGSGVEAEVIWNDVRNEISFPDALHGHFE
jgi:hypothetical protein